MLAPDPRISVKAMGRWAAALPALAGTAGLLVAAELLPERRRFVGTLSFVGHCVLPALLGAGLWAALLLRPPLRARLSAAVLAVTLAALGAELSLRAFFFPLVPDLAERSRLAAAAGVRFDRRTPFEVALDLRRAGVRAFPSVSAATVMEQGEGGRWRSTIALGDREVVPLGGVARVRTMLGNESGVPPEFTSDELGFNNPPGLWDTAPADVLLTGDSFTVGWGVAPEKNLAAPIRARYPRTVNVGMTGGGPLSELGQVRELGAALRPRRVVLFFYEGNDLRDLNREKASPLLQYLDPGFRQGLLERREEIDRALAAHADAELARVDSLWFKALGIVRLERVRGVTGFTPPPLEGSGPPDWPLLQRVLHEAKAAPAAWGGQLLFVFLPQWSRFAHPAGVGALDHARARILGAVGDEGIPVLDVVDVFTASGDPLDAFPYRLHGHYSERGYRLVGEAVAARLAASGLTPAAP